MIIYRITALDAEGNETVSPETFKTEAVKQAHEAKRAGYRTVYVDEIEILQTGREAIAVGLLLGTVHRMNMQEFANVREVLRL